MTHLPKLIFIGMAISILLAGCISAGPIPPVLSADNMSMLLLMLVVATGYFIWHKLASISFRLKALEKEIERLKNRIKEEDYD